MPAPAITLLTDFGTADGYVAEMKGVLTSMAPAVPLIDVSHDVPAQDVDFARLGIARYWRRFPAGSVHLAVVDPGVGSNRAALAVESGGRFLVGPDNGLLSPALFALDVRVVAIPVSLEASATFHGRDVFAPAAARLAMGEPLESVGEEFSDPVRLRTPVPQRQTDGSIAGEVIVIDRFGNAVTNLIARAGATIEIDAWQLPLSRIYSDAGDGEPLALVGSSGLVEIAVRNGNAAQVLGLKRGMRVVMR